ncbi:MAG: glycosyltransferase family 39 protein [Elusimicrobiota bacterium]
MLCIRLVIAALMPVSADEAYYYLYVINPALSYFDHPPMVALAGAVFSYAAGSFAPFFLRLGSIVFFSAALLPFIKLSSFFLDEESSAAASLAFLLVPVFFISGTLLLPDAPLIFFWVTGLLVFKKTVEKPLFRNWLLTGIVFGLALLSKYTAIFLYAGAFAYLLSDSSKRKLLRTYGPYISLLVSLLLFSPVILWNARNDFVSFAFHMGRGGGFKINLNYFFRFIGGQIVYLLPFFFLPAVYFAIKSLFSFKKNSYYSFVFSFGFIPLAFFLFYSLFSKTLPHWAVIAYIALCLPVGEYYAGLKRRKKKKAGFYALAHVLIVFLLISGALLQMRTGIFFNREISLSGAGERKNFKNGDISLEWLGWDKALKAVEEIGGEDKIFVFTDKWFIAGYLSYAFKDKYPVMVLSKLKNARGFAFWQKQNKYKGRDGLFITSSLYYSDRNEKYMPYFEKTSLKKAVPVKRRGKIVKYIYIYRYKNFLRAYPVKEEL